MAAAVLDKHWVQLGYGGHTIAPSAPRGVSYLLADDHPVRLVTPYLTEDERDEVLDTALLLRGLPPRPPAPTVREGITLSELSFAAPAAAPGADTAAGVVALAEPPVALVPDREAPPRPVAPDPDLAVVPEPPGVDPKLVDEAAELAVRFGHVSAQMLQRKLRINWDDTAWVLAELEDQGVIGPARAGRADREVLKKSPEALADAEANRVGYSRRKAQEAPAATRPDAEESRPGRSPRRRPHPRNRRLHTVPAPEGNENKKDGI
jgi:DNA segregation ATPase FtsK/SpoIIIE-like protein